MPAWHSHSQRVFTTAPPLAAAKPRRHPRVPSRRPRPDGVSGGLGKSRDPGHPTEPDIPFEEVTPAKAGVQDWIPASAGMTHSESETKCAQAACPLAVRSTEALELLSVPPCLRGESFPAPCRQTCERVFDITILWHSTPFLSGREGRNSSVPVST